MNEQRVENVIIVGSGPAGYTAALYTARANLEPLVVEGFAWGGLLQQTTDVENYPGFPEGIMGPELMQHFRDQAERFGARLETDDVTQIEISTNGGLHKVWISDEMHLTRALILAMGAQHRKLDVPGEAELSGRGVSYCATCDAAFFRDAPTLIIGGGDSAMEEAMFLSKFAKKVAIVHRRNEFRASKIMLERARAIPNIEWLTPYAVEEFSAGDGKSLSVARLRNTEDGSTREVEATGAFIAVGHDPQSQLVEGQVETDPAGYVVTAGPLDADRRARRVRRRRPRRSHLPPGGHRGGIGLPGGARRRVVPARHAFSADRHGRRHGWRQFLSVDSLIGAAVRRAPVGRRRRLEHRQREVLRPGPGTGRPTPHLTAADAGSDVGISRD